VQPLEHVHRPLPLWLLLIILLLLLLLLLIILLLVGQRQPLLLGQR
jgi:hypothetical protein